MESYYDTPLYYENDRISHFIPKGTSYEYLQIPKINHLNKEGIKNSFLRAITAPLNSPSLKELVTNHYKGNPVTILIDDNTRANIHTRVLLPLLEKELLEYGVKRSNIRIMVATGTHTPPTEEQIQKQILGELYSQWKDQLWLHNCDNDHTHVNLGYSSAKTPILIDERVFSSDIIIPLSDSEYHYFAGVAGSVKLILPGVSSRKTVRTNHSRIFDLNTGFKKNCKMGQVEGNVSIQDIREIVSIIQEKHKKSIFVIDAILDKGMFVEIFAGDPLAIHENATKILSKIRDVLLSKFGDLVIIGKPSVNYYQAGKAVNAAAHAVKQGGAIIVLAECADGIGPSDYLETMRIVKNKPFKEAMQWVIINKCGATTFEIGIQNAVDLFRVLQLTEDNIYLYSSLNPNIMKEVFHVQSLDTSKPVEVSLRLFVAEFLKHNPESHIIVFEDFNILAKP